MRSILGVAAIAMALAACGADGGQAGDTGGGTAVARTPCEDAAGCLRLQELILLGEADGEGMIEGEFGTARRDSRGRYYVYREFGQEIKVFSPSGDYLETIGREGSGPGEFRGVSFAHPGPDDSLHVLDLFNLRWSVFSPEHELVRSVQLEVPVYMQLSLLPDGRGLFSAPVRGKLGAYPLHLLDAKGHHQRSFGAAPAEFGDPGRDGDWRKITPAGPTSVWAAYRDRYRIELWDAAIEADDPLRVIEREVDWFPPGVPEEISLESPPVTRIQAVRQDSAGRLLVLMHVADERWREVVETGGFEATISDRHLYYDSRIEVLDADSGELLDWTVHPLVFHAFVADNLVIASVTDSAGAPRVAVWSISIPGEP